MSDDLIIDGSTTTLDGAVISFDAVANNKVEISQASLFILSSSPTPKVEISQAFLFVLVNSYIDYRPPPVIKLPCQSNCLQFFDLRK